jgi:uncharacterized protein
MDDKDRLGDKLRDKAKASEDLFIAEQERQRRLRREQEAAAKGTGPTGLCPRDGAKLEPRSEKGITIDACPACGGVWLDRGELEAFHKVEGEAGVTRWVRSLLGT